MVSQGNRFDQLWRDRMDSKRNNAFWGKVVFGLTVVAMLSFFWWLLIFDHGVKSVH